MTSIKTLSYKYGKSFLILATIAAMVSAGFGFLFNSDSAEALPLSLKQVTEVSDSNPQLNADVLNNLVMTPDGLWVVFVSGADNIVEDDNNNAADVFIYNTQTKQVELVSVSSSGEQGNDASGGTNAVSVSSDGNFVAFESEANNLVADDNNYTSDIFVRNRSNGTTERVSVNSDGDESSAYAGSYNPSISANGNFVAFESWADNLVDDDTNFSLDIFVRNRSNGTTERVSVSSDEVEANGQSSKPSISANGNVVAFESDSDNLVADDTNFSLDIFVRNRSNGTTERVSVNSDGDESNSSSFNPSISSDGTKVAFLSDSSNLVPGDTNSAFDGFVHTVGGGTIRVSVATGGAEHDGSYVASVKISPNGLFVSFIANADNLSPDDGGMSEDAFVHDIQNVVTERVSVGIMNPDRNSPGNNYTAGVSNPSNDGSKIAFVSYADNLTSDPDTNGVQDLFIRTLSSTPSERNTEKVEAYDGYVSIEDGDGNTHMGKTSPDGRYVVFATAAGNLLPEDTNGLDDIYLYDRQDDILELISVKYDGSPIDGSYTHSPSVSADGRYVVYGSAANDIVSGDNDFMSDIFIRDRLTNTNERITTAFGGGNPDSNSYAPIISADGNIVVFLSQATNLVATDNGNNMDVFLWDRNGSGNKISLVSVSTAGIQADGESTALSMSDDGNFIAFVSRANNLSDDPEEQDNIEDVFVRNVSAGTTTYASVGNQSLADVNNIYNASLGSVDISNDGRYVVFATRTNLYDDEVFLPMNGVYVRDMVNNVTERISINYDGTAWHNWSEGVSISGDGRYVVFESTTSDLILPGEDTNGQTDVFIRDRQNGTTERVSETPAGEESPNLSSGAYISSNGLYITFLNGPAIVASRGINLPGASVKNLYIAGYEALPETLPTVVTEAPTSVGINDMDLEGDITNTGNATITERGFEYGTTMAYGSDVSETGSFGAGDFSLSITGLDCATTYYYRAYATNSQGTAYGSMMSGTTLACAPGGVIDVVTNIVTGLTQNFANLNGTILDAGLAFITNRGFNYGLTMAYGSVVSESGVFGTGPFSLPLSGLTCNTTYNYQAYITDGVDTVLGGNESFTTPACSSGGGGGSGSTPITPESPVPPVVSPISDNPDVTNPVVLPPSLPRTGIQVLAIVILTISTLLTIGVVGKSICHKQTE